MSASGRPSFFQRRSIAFQMGMASGFVQDNGFEEPALGFVESIE